jgi:hypothetical protein
LNWEETRRERGKWSSFKLCKFSFVMKTKEKKYGKRKMYYSDVRWWVWGPGSSVRTLA